MFYAIAKYDDKKSPEEVMKELKGSVKAIENVTKSKTTKADIEQFIIAYREKDKKAMDDILSKYK